MRRTERSDAAVVRSPVKRCRTPPTAVRFYDRPLRYVGYAAWPAWHRESNHFIKMIGRVARNFVPEISGANWPGLIRIPALQVWNVAQTRSYPVKLANANSTK